MRSGLSLRLDTVQETADRVHRTPEYKTLNSMS